MEFGFTEYALMTIIAVGLPVWGAFEFRRLRVRLAANDSSARIGTYRLGISVQWIITVVVLVDWLGGGRRLSTLGLGFEPGLAFWIAGSLTLAACLALIVQTVTVVRSEKKLAEIRKQFGSLEIMIPRDDREARWWTGLSITAGICEEIIYRGFMIAVVAATVGTWPAVGLAAVVFGIGHAYQGPRGMIKTTAVGLVLGSLFVLAGSLWAPMLLHAVVDLTSGYMGRRAVPHSAATPSASVTT
jgi:membrane protease YdiL (CAAX protease family)